MLVSGSINSPLLSTLEFLPSRRDGTVIMGIPSSLERDFSRIHYSRGVSLLLQKTKIDYCLIFAINRKKLEEDVEKILPHLKDNAMLWIAFPKPTSKIMTTLNTCDAWNFMHDINYYKYRHVVIDTIWGALRFIKTSTKSIDQIQETKSKVDIAEFVNHGSKDIVLHPSMELAFTKYSTTYDFFKGLSFEHKVSYLAWIHTIKKEIVLQKRILEAVSKMDMGVLDPYLETLVK